ncbi:MAG: hypothetical protein ABJQ34_04660 [Paracoccaceae bacterium]|uniref:hypothetical protein n=1 Tax=Pseudophaeobacter sp. TaxID=1971739 RepID=UPI003297F53E
MTSSFVPELDDTEFATLVEDGRGLIPQYASDWTDHNMNDPGITLIDLIAYLVDQQIYRVGFVGESLRGAFTRLMGVAPRGPKAAELLVWPTPGSLPILDLEAGTRAHTPDITEAEFTVSNHVRTVAVQIAGVSLVIGAREKPLGDGLTEGRDPVTLMPHVGGGPRALILDFSDAIQQLAGVGPVSLGIEVQERAGAEDADWDAITIEQEDPGGFWHPLVVKDGTKGLARTGVILFEPSPLSEAKRFRLRLDRGFRPAPVTVTRLDLNVLPLREGRYDAEAVIGEGNGLPDQRIDFFHDDIVDRERSLKVFTRADAWTLVGDLERSGPQDRHVRLTPEGLAFGNGLNGQVVPLGAQVRVDPLRRTQGHAGAVAKGLSWVVAGQTYGSNIAASSLGRNRDSFGDLARRARQVAKRRRAVLGSDLLQERLMGAGLGLARVQVSPRRRPGLEGAEAPGSRTVIILPTRDPSQPPGPATEEMRDRVEAYLAPMRLLGERFYISHPLYVPVEVDVDLVVEADADRLAILAQAETAIRARLWDVPRVAGQQEAPWQAGRDVTIGEIEGMMAEIAQVVQVPGCRIARAGAALGRDVIVLKDREIALAQSVVVRVIEGGAL